MILVEKENLPIITLVGQRNVGKSTLFNKLTCTNTAVISNDKLGCTRDRQYGYIKHNKYRSIIIDTGGFDTSLNTEMQNCINNQVILAVKEAHIVFFVINGMYKKASVIDYSIVDSLRKFKKEIFLVVNKIDDIFLYDEKYIVLYDYYILGIKNIIAISAIHGYGISDLLKKAFLKISKKLCVYDENAVFDINQNNNKHKCCNKFPLLHNDNCIIKLVIIGRPNSGKSTFVNFLLKTNRMITSSMPGTTRDSICIPLTYNNQKYILIDTAGVRKNKNINNIIERCSVEKTLQMLKYSYVTLFMIDAAEGIVDQDLVLLSLVKHNSKSLIIVINKWDTSVIINSRKSIVESILRTKIRYFDFFRVHFISSLYGNGIESLFRSIKEIYSLSNRTFNTSQLNRIMYASTVKNPPPLICGTRIAPKLKYVHIGSYNPIIIVVHGNQVTQLSCEYKRYLTKCFYKALGITGVYIRVTFRDTINPFVGKI